MSSDRGTLGFVETDNPAVTRPEGRAAAGGLTTTARRVRDRKWLSLVVLSISTFGIGIDMSGVSIALSRIVEGLHATGAELQWIVTSATATFACLLITAGALGDRYGRRRMLTLGIAIQGIFAAVGAFAPSPTVLIAARCVSGAGAALVFPAVASTIANIFTDPRERARAIGVWSGISALGISVGPLLGGFVVQEFGWRAIFLMTTIVCAVIFPFARWFIPDTGVRLKRPLDPYGAVLSILTVACLLVGVIEAPARGWTDPVVVAGFAGAVLFLFLFLFIERRLTAPMVDLRIYRNPRFAAGSATSAIAFFGLFASSFILIQYLQFVLDYSPFMAGVMITAVSIGQCTAGPIAPRLVQWAGTKRVVVAALSLMGTTVALYSSDTVMSSMPIGYAIRVGFGIGMGLLVPSLMESVVGALPRDSVGTGSAVNDTTRQAAGAIGTAVTGSVLAASFHGAFASEPLPHDVPAPARDSIGEALRVAGEQSPELARQISAAARDAFVSSMRVSYAIAVAAFGIAAFIAARYLPARAQVDVVHVERARSSGDEP